VNFDRLAQSRDTAAARNGDVNAKRDDVRQPMAGKSRDETERASRRAVGDFP
jgi:hypothetical protein